MVPGPACPSPAVMTGRRGTRAAAAGRAGPRRGGARAAPPGRAGPRPRLRPLESLEAACRGAGGGQGAGRACREPARHPDAGDRSLEVVHLHGHRELVGVLDRGLRHDAQVLCAELQVLPVDVVMSAGAVALDVVLHLRAGAEALLLPLAEGLELGGRDEVGQLDQVVVLARDRDEAVLAVVVRPLELAGAI